MLMPFEWDVRVSSKDHTVTASTSETIRPPSGYTTLRDSTQEIYDTTRGHWKIAPWVRDRAQYALGIAYGVVRGAYRVDSWFPSEKEWDRGKNRWGFVGESAPELAHVVGTHVRDAFPNQVMYRRFIHGYAGTADPA